MNPEQKFLISIVAVLIVMSSSLKLIEGPPILNAQSVVAPQDIVNPVDARIIDNIFGCCLEVRYRWNGDLLESEQSSNNVGLILSKDNISWIEVARQFLNESELHSNVSRKFRICNSLFKPFPFDVAQGETIFIGIEFEFERTYSIPEYDPNVRLYLTAIEAPKDIVRLWYFTIDWTLPGIFGALFLSAFSVFLMSRHHRKQMESEIRKKRERQREENQRCKF